MKSAAYNVIRHIGYYAKCEISAVSLRLGTICTLCLTSTRAANSLQFRTQTRSDSLNSRVSFLQYATAAGALFLGVSGSVRAQEARVQEAPDAVIERVLQEANELALAGKSTAVVERFIADRLEATGMEAETEPPAWDVYGRVRWQRETQETVSTSPASGAGIPATANMRAVYQENSDGRKPADAETNVLSPESAAAGPGDVVRGGISRPDPQQGRAAIVHFQNTARLDVKSFTNMEAGVLHANSTQQGGSSLSRP
jgi:hypothetical protein